MKEFVYSIYYNLGSTKMWHSLVKNEDGEFVENCVSHEYRRMIYSGHLIKNKLDSLKKLHPSIDWEFQQF